MPMQNPVVGGVFLVRSAIQSPNFQSGVSGWAIMQDGSAEFDDVVIRGGTVVDGQAFYYNGTPSSSTLLVAIAGMSGTDPYGTAYSSGFNLYDGAGNFVGLWNASGFYFASTDNDGQVNIQEQGNDSSGNPMSPILNVFADPAITAAGGSLASFAQEFPGPNQEILILRGPIALPAVDSAGSNTAVNLFAGTAVAGAVGNLQFQDQSTTLDVLTWGVGGGALLGTATGVQPGTGSSATPAVAEGWHSPAFGSGWATGPFSGSFQPVQYRLLPNGCVQLIGAFHQTSTTPASPIWTMPTGYHPTVAQIIPCVRNLGGTISATTLLIDTSGNVTLGTNPGNAGDCYVNLQYRLA